MYISYAMAVQIAIKHLNEPLKMLMLLDGYYNGLNDDGQVIGPLVTYAAEYEPKKRYVGWEYANWAKIEMFPEILKMIADRLNHRIPNTVNCLAGVPDGGRTFATILAMQSYRRHVYLEKKVITLATETEKAKSDLVFARHEPVKGEVVGLVEDVGNHFSSTAKSIDKVVAKKATVGVIICLHNRSQEVRDTFNYNGVDIPVVSYLDHPMVDYRQDDPAVADQVEAGNLVSDPKKVWPSLKRLMKRAAA